MTRVWRRDIICCPLNKKVSFLCDLISGGNLFEIIGTLTTNPYDGTIIRGKCLEGDSDIFYRSAIIGWREIDE